MAGLGGVSILAGPSQAYRWDGGRFRPMGAPLPVPGPFIRVAGGNGEWLMSERSEIWWWNGADWQPLTEHGSRLRAMAKRGDDELWVVGDGGFSARRAKGRWRRVETGTRADLRFLESRGEELWAATWSGGVLRFVDGAWQPMGSEPSSVSGLVLGDSDVLLYGSDSRRWSDTSGQWEPVGGFGLSQLARDVDGTLFGVSSYGGNGSVTRRDGDFWTALYTTPHSLGAIDVWKGEIWAGGNDGVVHLSPLGVVVELPSRGRIDWVRAVGSGEAYVGMASLPSRRA